MKTVPFILLLILALTLTSCTYPFRCSGVFVCGSERGPLPQPQPVDAVNETEEPSSEPN